MGAPEGQLDVRGAHRDDRRQAGRALAPPVGPL
jgi:hypothetical protein